MNTNRENRRARENRMLRMVSAAMLVGLIILLGFTPIGFINIGIVNISFLSIPVIVGTVAMGYGTGLVLGFCFGALSFYKAITAATGLVAPILQVSVFWIILLCFIPRLLIPTVTHLVWKLLKNKNEKTGLALSAFAGSLTNTVFYLGLMVVFYYLLGIENSTVLATVGGLCLTAGLPEAAAAALLTTPIILALKKAGLLKKLYKE